MGCTIQDVAEARTRANRLDRKVVPRLARGFVGSESMKRTCPRCGWPCTHIVSCYYDSPWNEHGGICSACIQEAVALFDTKGWPPDPSEAKPKPTETVEKLGLFDS